MEDENETEKQVIPGYKSVDDFTKVESSLLYLTIPQCSSFSFQEGFKALMEAIKASNALPSDKDYDFYKVHESFQQIMHSQGDSVMGLMNTLLRKQGISHNFRTRGLEEKLELLVEANDVILERVANDIDEMNGIRKNIAPLVANGVELQAVTAHMPISGSWNRATISVGAPTDNDEVRLL